MYKVSLIPRSSDRFYGWTEVLTCNSWSPDILDGFRALYDSALSRTKVGTEFSGCRRVAEERISKIQDTMMLLMMVMMKENET